MERMEILMKEIKEDTVKCRNEMKEQGTATRTELSTQIGVLAAKVDACLSSYETLSTQVAELRLDMEAKHSDLENRLVKLESDPPHTPVAPLAPVVTASAANSPYYFEEMMAELEDRRRRAPNIMVYDFKEPDASIPNILAIEEDLKSFKAKLNELSPELVGLVQRLARIGVREPGKCRPLKVTFESPSSATKFLVTNRAKTPPLFSASSDKTPKQREYLNQLRAKLKHRTDAGEENLTIKYVNFQPQIITQAPHRSANRPSNY